MLNLGEERRGRFTVEVIFELICVGECSRKVTGIYSKQKNFCRSTEG